MPDFGYLNVIDARDPHWDIGNKTITLDVLFEGLKDSGKYLPFTASPLDIEPHGRQIFSDAYAGKYGDIAPPTEPTRDELIAKNRQQKNSRLREASDKITIWQTKLLMGRTINDAEMAELNLWIDYIDAVTAVDINQKPNIQWPEKP